MLTRRAPDQPAGDSPPVAAHKLFSPRAHAGTISRDALLDLMLGDESIRIVLLHAPAGHGKTTLMEQAKSLLEEGGTRTGWLSLDEADSDANRLLLHLQALLAEFDERPQGVPEASQPGGALPNRGGTDWFSDRLVTLGYPVAIFLDDFHTLTSKSINNFFKVVLARLPRSVRVFIGSRTHPDLGLARLVVNNEALILSTRDLCFTPEEIERFFAQTRGLALNARELEAVSARTEGWPAALQLYRLSLSRPAVRDSLANIDSPHLSQLAEYLVDNVLSLQPLALQDFLLHTSLLVRLSGSLCDEVMGTAGSQRVLEQLVAAGLFIRHLDSDVQWFSYHALFSSFLRAQLESQDPHAVTRIHATAADWFRQHGMYEETLHHAVAGGRHDLAAEALELWAGQLVMDGHLTTVEYWSDRIPLAELVARPHLGIRVAYALAFLHRRDKLEPLLERLDLQARTSELGAEGDVLHSMIAVLHDDLPAAVAVVDPVDVFGMPANGFRAFELAAAANLKGYLAIVEGSFETAQEYLGRARVLGELAGARFSWGYSAGVAALRLLLVGELDEALKLCRWAAADPRIGLDEPVSSATVACVYIQALYEADDLETAESYFTRFKESIASTGMHDFVLMAYVSMARVRQVQGRRTEAQEILDEAEAIGQANSWPRVVNAVRWERVRQALCDGEPDRAVSIARLIVSPRTQSVPPSWLQFAEDTEGALIGQIRLAVHEGHGHEAIERLRRELSVAHRTGRARRHLKLLVLDAIAYRLQGDSNMARRQLYKALRLAAPKGYVRIFLDEGPVVVGLLEEIHQLTASRDDDTAAEVRPFLEILLASAGDIGTPANPAGEQPPPTVALSRHEEEILRLLAAGLSNKEISQRVFVSENTVKFHLKHVYVKLHVDSRIQATLMAQKLGLVRRTAL